MGGEVLDRAARKFAESFFMGLATGARHTIWKMLTPSSALGCLHPPMHTLSTGASTCSGSRRASRATRPASYTARSGLGSVCLVRSLRGLPLHLDACSLAVQ